MAALITTPRLMSVGGGALADLPGLMARLGLSRPLIVTDPYIASCGILDRATGLLDGAGLAWSVFSDTVSDPTTEVIGTGVRIRRGGFRQPDRDRRRSIDTRHVGAVRQCGAMCDYKVPAGSANGTADHASDHRRHWLRGHPFYQYRHRK